MAFLHHHAPEARPSDHDLCLVIQGDRLLARPEVDPTVRLPDYGAAEPWRGALGQPLHVGLLEGIPCWLWGMEPMDAVAPPGWQWHDTRALLSALTASQLQAVSCARQLLWWDRRHRFCGVCGTPTREVVGERARHCPRCGAVFFPVASPAVIVAVTRGEELLLAHNRKFRGGMFSLLAGFVDPGESLEQAVAREVREEVGVEVDDLRYVASQPWSFPNSLMLGFRARWVGGDIVVDGREIDEAAWFRRDRLPDLPRSGTVARTLIEAWRTGPV